MKRSGKLHQKRKKYIRSLTIVEILVAIGIISVITAVSVIAYSTVYNRTRAVKIARDMQEIARAWRVWQTDTNSSFPPENNYGINDGETCEIDPGGATLFQCDDEPPITRTPIMSNVDSDPSWRGPYIRKLPKDPYGKEYAYDNDCSAGEGSPGGGVNVQLTICCTDWPKYQKLFPIIDKMIDGGDGENAGKFISRSSCNDNPGSNNDYRYFLLKVATRENR